MVTHRTLDGRSVHLSGPWDLTLPYTSVAKIALDGRLHEFTTSDINSARAWAHDLGVRTFSEEFALQGGRLRLARTSAADSQTGVDDQVLICLWEGRSHALYTHLYHATATDAVGVFNALTLTEHADGISVSPGRNAAFAEPAELVKEVPGLGLLEITALTKQTARRLPAWSGARIAGGELFQDTLEDQGIFFLLSTGSALVTVLPAGEDENEPARVANQLHALDAQIK